MNLLRLIDESTAGTYGQYQRRRRAFTRLARHVARTRDRHLRDVSERLITYKMAVEAAPSARNLRDLSELQERVDRFLDDLQAKGLDRRLLDHIGRDLEAKERHVRESLYGTRGFAPDDEQSAPHRKLVAALNEIGADIDRWEAVADGMFAYVPSECSQDLLDNPDKLQGVLDRHGYLCIKRGIPNDPACCPFGTDLVQWMFLHAPETEDVGTEFKPANKDAISVNKETLAP